MPSTDDDPPWGLLLLTSPQGNAAVPQGRLMSATAARDLRKACCMVGPLHIPAKAGNTGRLRPGLALTALWQGSLRPPPSSCFQLQPGAKSNKDNVTNDNNFLKLTQYWLCLIFFSKHVYISIVSADHPPPTLQSDGQMSLFNTLMINHSSLEEPETGLAS